MRVNFQYAIGIIAALSLLLGLSLGQLHHQYKEIEKLKQDPVRFHMVTLRPATTNFNHIQRYDKIRRCIDQELQTRLDIENIRILREKALLEEINATIREGTAQEVTRDKTHVILQEEL
jgi:hypothetical protein